MRLPGPSSLPQVVCRQLSGSQKPSTIYFASSPPSPAELHPCYTSMQHATLSFESGHSIRKTQRIISTKGYNTLCRAIRHILKKNGQHPIRHQKCSGLSTASLLLRYIPLSRPNSSIISSAKTSISSFGFVNISLIPMPVPRSLRRTRDHLEMMPA